MRAACYCDVTLIYYSDTVSMDAFIITMALSARAIQHGAHRHDRRGIYRCVLLRFRGRIEIDHSYGLRCRGLCCHSRHSTRGPAVARPLAAAPAAAARRPAHECCAGSGSTNHDSADRIVVNSYSSIHLPHKRYGSNLPSRSTPTLCNLWQQFAK